MSCQKNLHCLQICFNICELLLFKIFIWPIIILLSVYVDFVIIGRISFNKDIKMLVYIMLQQILEHGKNKQWSWLHFRGIEIGICRQSYDFSYCYPFTLPLLLHFALSFFWNIRLNSFGSSNFWPRICFKFQD